MRFHEGIYGPGTDLELSVDLGAKKYAVNKSTFDW
jgi:hypothetical protein